MPPRPTIFAKTRILIISAILAGIIVNGLVPTPNVTNGGAEKMLLILVVMVLIKATIEWRLRRRTASKETKPGDDQPRT